MKLTLLLLHTLLWLLLQAMLLHVSAAAVSVAVADVEWRAARHALGLNPGVGRHVRSRVIYVQLVHLLKGRLLLLLLLLRAMVRQLLLLHVLPLGLLVELDLVLLLLRLLHIILPLLYHRRILAPPLLIRAVLPQMSPGLDLILLLVLHKGRAAIAVRPARPFAVMSIHPIDGRVR